MASHLLNKFHHDKLIEKTSTTQYVKKKIIKIN